MTGTLSREIDRVVTSGNCSGCGACSLLSDAVKMELSEDGHLRPTVAPTAGSLAAAKQFRRVCPGVSVSRPRRPQNGSVHPTFGPYLEAWEGWAADTELRLAGSSGGVISALSQFVLECSDDGGTAVPGRSGVAAAQSPVLPTRTSVMRLTSNADVANAAGSRYAPVANASEYSKDLSFFVGKPCEVSATRAFDSVHGTEKESSPVRISFFCAGTPSQHATDSLVSELGVVPADATAVRYRGDGWPGFFSVTASDGSKATTTYQDSWGRVLGRQLPWRCKLCPDGTGMHADISVGDYWEAGENGYPSFTERAGTSVVLARTARGAQLLRLARLRGVVVLAPADLKRASSAQPLQVERRKVLAGRLFGRLLVGRRVPRYKGFGVLVNLARHPLANCRSFAGSMLRQLSRPSKR